MVAGDVDYAGTDGIYGDRVRECGSSAITLHSGAKDVRRDTGPAAGDMDTDSTRFGAVNAGPFLPTAEDCLCNMLGALDINEGDVFLDLGCGDGRIVKAVSRKFGCYSVGVEYDEQVLVDGLIAQGLMESTDELVPLDQNGTPHKPLVKRPVQPSIVPAVPRRADFLCCDMFLVLSPQGCCNASGVGLGVPSQLLKSPTCLLRSLSDAQELVNRKVTMIFVYLLPEIHNLLAPYFLEKFRAASQDPDCCALRQVISFWWPIDGLVGCEEMVIKNTKSGSQDTSRTFVYSRDKFEKVHMELDRDSL